MSTFKFGDIVLIKFPYSDKINFKKRPALVLNDFDDGDIIVCRITSKMYETKNDIIIENWEKCGLLLPSIIRIHKLATLEKTLVELVIGEISNKTKENVTKAIFNNYLNLKL